MIAVWVQYFHGFLTMSLQFKLHLKNTTFTNHTKYDGTEFIINNLASPPPPPKKKKKMVKLQFVILYASLTLKMSLAPNFPNPIS